MAATEPTAVQTEQLEAAKELTAHIFEQTTKRMSGRPTPTQEECNKAALGIHVAMHEDDGSGPDPRAPVWHGGLTGGHPVKTMEAKPGGGYSTRASTASRASTHSSSGHTS
jgi:hypothetical protein